MIKNRVIVILLVTAILFLASCSKQPEATVTAPSGVGVNDTDKEQNVLKLPYSANDSLNPYFALSEVNSQLDAVLYQPLYKIGSNYNEVPVLALNGKVKGNLITVTLNEAYFSDSSRITPEDVIYSFSKALESKAYASLLYPIESATVGDDGSVVFEMVSANQFALSLLTFPIVKNMTAESADTVPVGSGPFVATDDKTFEKNPVNSNAKIQKIELVDISKAIDEAYVLQTGDISFCFDSLHGGSYNKINAVTRSVLMNNLVYLGFNCNKKAFSDANVRAAVACAVDIEKIAQNAFRGNAVATRLPFNPNWSKAKDISAVLNSASALSYLEKSGYNKLGYDGIRSDGETLLNFKILVNSDNSFRVETAQMIADSLNDLGFRVSVDKVDYERYQKDIADGDFDMYVGEIKLGADMNLDTFFFEGGLCSAGINHEGETAKAYTDVLCENMTVEAFTTVFMRDIPFAPLCFRTGVAASLRGVNLNIETDKWYSDIELWSY
jgi:peptide/nickel transport system substrate-binding protein